MISFEEFFANIWEIERNLTKKLYSLQKLLNKKKAHGMFSLFSLKKPYFNDIFTEISIKKNYQHQKTF